MPSWGKNPCSNQNYACEKHHYYLSDLYGRLSPGRRPVAFGPFRPCCLGRDPCTLQLADGGIRIPPFQEYLAFLRDGSARGPERVQLAHSLNMKTKTFLRGAFLTAVILSTLPVGSLSTLPVGSRVAEVPIWQRFEVALESDTDYKNPLYDVPEFFAHFIAPSGRRLKINGFWPVRPGTEDWGNLRQGGMV